jgi:hypothetical protein
MTASQIPYDAIDWLQIVIYFLALPVVALAGSLIGLLGRIRRGGVFWSANVGMLAGAVTCLTCGLAIGTLNQKLPTEFIDYFASDYRWRMLAATLGATCACAFVAAIAWRFLHKPGEKQPFSFSLRQVLLLQLFSFLGLGCWISLRLFVLNSTDPRVLAERQLERLKARWEANGWTVDPKNGSVSIDLNAMTYSEGQKALAFATIAEAAQLPRLENLSVSGVDDANLDLTPFFQKQSPKGVGLSLKNYSENIIEQFGKSNVEYLSLNNPGSVDLSSLADNRSLRAMGLSGKITRESFSKLSKSASLKKLTFWQMKFVEGDAQAAQKATIQWPPQLEDLQMSDPLSHRDFATLANHQMLSTLYAFNQRLNDYDVAVLAALPNLKKTDVWIGRLSERGDASLRARFLQENASGFFQLRVDSPPFDESVVQKLKTLRGIKSLRLYWADVGDEVMDDLAEMPDLEMLHFMSPQITQEGIMRLATLPNLKYLFYPVHLNTKTFEKDFAAKRVELDLAPVDLTAMQLGTAPPYTEPEE